MTTMQARQTQQTPPQQTPPGRWNRLGRHVATALACAACVVFAASCGNDSEGTASTTTKPAASSTSSTPPTREGGVEMHLGDRTVALTSESCSSDNQTSVKLSATDGSGNTLTVDASYGSGSAVFRGPSEDWEGSVSSVQVSADGTFSVGGKISVADDSAPAPDELSVTGLCD